MNSCPHYLREMHGLKVPFDIYVHIAGIDLIRDYDGTFYILEDNLRTPSGVSRNEERGARFDAGRTLRSIVEDKSPNAWEKVIDTLLQSPHYGEQWGRHWLDVAGYSDSRGDAGDSDRILVFHPVF